MRTLLLIPLKLADDRHRAVQAGERPQADYDALAAAIRSIPGSDAMILDLNSVERSTSRFVKLVSRLFGKYVALALLGHMQSPDYDAVFSHGEAVGIPFALLSYLRARRPCFVTNAYYLIGRRNAFWFRLVKIYRRMDKILVLAREQYDVGRERLRIPPSRLQLVDCCGYVDSTFFGVPQVQTVNDRQICSTGLEFRDYTTLIKAVADLPHVRLKIDPGSPWSRHKVDLGDAPLPENVEICRLPIGAARALYAESAAVVIPLHENRIGAGTTVLAEAMLAGKPVIVTSSQGGSFAGWPDLVDGENIVMVRPGDVAGWRAAIDRLISDRDWRLRIAERGRRWAEQNADRRRWLDIMLDALHSGSQNPLARSPRLPRTSSLAAAGAPDRQN